ncbi:MAG: hypothetical protein FWF28_05385, partial [Micrococcales bacterium]|nr:hypothetical protein [Micrococcales bacterium]
MRSLQRRTIGIAAIVVAGALTVAGCSSSSPNSGSPTTPAPAGPSSPAAANTPDTNSAAATVTIYGTPIGDEATQWENSWSTWAKANNITIQYTGDRDFNTNIATKIQGNALPDIAVFPQPGLMQAALATGKAQPLDAATLANVKQNFTDSWQTYGTYQGQQYAVPLDA